MSNGPRWSVEGRDWPLAAHSRFVDAARLRWHVQRLGNGPVIVMLHGTGAATHSWRGLAPLLATRFSIVTLDLPGHGFTQGVPRGGMSLPAIARAVTALLDRLNVRPTLLVGHSAGAAIAVRMALDGLPVDGLVGLSPALQPFPGIAARLFPTLAKLLFVNPIAPHLFAALARRPGETARFLRRSTGSSIEPAGIEFYARLFATVGHCAGAIRMMAEWDLVPLAKALPTLDPPLLLVHGTGDAAIPTASVEASAAAAPDGRVELLRDLGHLAHEERPDLVAAAIMHFAAMIGAGGADRSAAAGGEQRRGGAEQDRPGAGARHAVGKDAAHEG